ncbi:MAG: ABC transporter permease [Cereibacter changlensis]|jgi:peptide/nickel transport system permease protein|uniref:Glutathione ABC transporter permease GsiC n=2 Tax=Cereibacter changlensis TaxID=402884 RepID=A0A2T4JXQ1_9RHOB|nr:ABC transporter permease [Cereibacter changlensis]PTE22702.1 glutathione ABC transporter permease GsiC [Cereibacter changlensis JA139]PZX51701.1 peptide/nickel transport system permease protein [Cereibacter changlensis]TKA98174.1 ABC transporter permease [Cereibacter changlensis]
MLAFLLRRVATALAMLLVVGTIIFSMLAIVPGDPAELLLSTGGGSASEEAIRNLRLEMGLDRPLLQQYLTFLGDSLRFDFGTSIVDGSSIAEAIALRLPRTLEIIAAGAVLALLLSIPAGTLAGLRAGGRFDGITSGLNALLTSIPGFVLGTLFIYVFAQVLGVLPAGGYVAFAEDPAQHLQMLILPAVTVALHLSTIIFRMTRASVLEMRGHDWVRTATAKGLSRGLVVRRHILRNALGPVITVVGLQLGILLGSTVLVEFVYNWPGLSGLLVTAVEQRDYPTVRAIILTVAAIFIGINLVIDILYSLLDPRIALQ